MATLATLRKKAKAAGVRPSVLRKATAAELRDLLAESNGKPRKASAVKAVKKAKAVKATKSATKRAPAAKSTKGKAKRPAVRASSNGKSGRNVILSVDFGKTKNWNPRTGSAPDRIIKALAKAQGKRTVVDRAVREKAFDALREDVWDFMSKTKRNGQKRTKADAHAMLRYRIHRTLFDFVIKTGQHKVSTNRIKYGTGINASKATQRKLAKNRTKPVTRKATGRKRGRPKGSKNRVK